MISYYASCLEKSGSHRESLALISRRLPGALLRASPSQTRSHFPQSKPSRSPGGAVLAGLDRQVALVHRQEWVLLSPTVQTPSRQESSSRSRARWEGLDRQEGRAWTVRKGCGLPEPHTSVHSAVCVGQSPLPEFASWRGRRMRTHSHDPASTRAPPHLELRDKWSSQEQPILPPDGCVTLGSLFSLSVPQSSLL